MVGAASGLGPARQAPRAGPAPRSHSRSRLSGSRGSARFPPRPRPAPPAHGDSRAERRRGELKEAAAKLWSYRSRSGALDRRKASINGRIKTVKVRPERRSSQPRSPRPRRGRVPGITVLVQPRRAFPRPASVLHPGRDAPILYPSCIVASGRPRRGAKLTMVRTCLPRPSSGPYVGLRAVRAIWRAFLASIRDHLRHGPANKKCRARAERSRVRANAHLAVNKDTS